MTHEAGRLMGALWDLLAAERQALRDGDFAALAPIAIAKSRHLEALAGAIPAPSARDLENLRREADASSRALLAAREGIASARRRLAEMQRVADRLDTYDSRGKLQSAVFAKARVERRV